MATITEIKGNIFESSCQTLVNTVNCVGVMGKGIAFEYRHRFPDMYEAYATMCAHGRLRPGMLHLWKKGAPWILNFPTKQHWKHPAKMEYIEAGLGKFADSFQSRGITSIAFPELGTSLGGLCWQDVRESMYRHLGPLPNLSVEIYHFDPEAQDCLFDRFYQKVHRFDIQDYKNYLNLPPRQARLIRDAVNDEQITSMRTLQELPGIGEKSLERIYNFLDPSRPNRLITNAERQPGLEFG